MKKLFLSLKIPTVLTICGLALSTAQAEKALKPVYSPNVVATVKHLTRVKILQSNNVSLRPGSIYDNATYFESLLDVPRPGFNYEFLDSGLGAAEPLYPMFQKGNQGNYLQLGKAALSESNRHIDHYSSMDTPEGCRVEGVYMLRNISEYAPNQFVQERAEGYKHIVVRLEYYTRLRPDAQCGRHFSHDPDPSFDPMKFVTKYHNAMTLADFPAKELELFEYKVSAIYHIKQTLSPKWPRFDLNHMKTNSLWYYPEGHAFDFGLTTARPQPGLSTFQSPAQMVVPATSRMQEEFSLSRLMTTGQFAQVMAFLSGKPTPNFDPATEPGRDVFSLSQVTSENLYTSGLKIEKIRDVVGDVSDPRHYKLVAMTIKPYELQLDRAWQGVRVVPQIRFVFQMMNPREKDQPVEQLFLHMKWDVIDRLASEDIRLAQHQEFLKSVDELSAAQKAHPENSDQDTADFIRKFTSARPVEAIAFSSALTGIWEFGTLSREQSVNRQLEALRIVREGIDYGFYSSTFDNDVLRAEIEKATGARKEQLEKIIDDITVSTFRDSKRQNVHAIDFNRLTCAQCHQTSGRDGVHVSLNDGLDRRFTAPVNATEYFFHEADQQLQSAVEFWVKKKEGASF